MFPRGLFALVLCGIVSSPLAGCGSESDAEPGGSLSDGTSDGSNNAGGGGNDGGGGDSSGNPGGGGNNNGGGNNGGGNNGGGGNGGGNGGGGNGGGSCAEPGETDIRFPMAVDGYYIISGYSGDGEQNKVQEGSCPTRAGEQRGHCHAFTYEPGTQKWAAIFWQFPPHNWGGAVGRTIPKGATQLSFYAWSDNGGETVSFGAGLKGEDAFSVEVPMKLESTPTRYTIPLANRSYCGDVVSAFFWSAKAQSDTFTFYVDDIVWEGENLDSGVTPVPPDPTWPAGPGAQGVSLRVRNYCPFPLFIGGGGEEAALSPARVRLGPGDVHNYDVPKVWTAARVNAFGAERDAQDPRDKAELTFYEAPDGFHVSYNITYVDWVGLPMEIEAVGGSCSNAHTIGCYKPVEELLASCPHDFLIPGNRCMSPRSHCLNPARQGEAYCHALDSVIASCAGCPKGTTTEAYACNGPFQEDPRWCAAVNRGMTHAPDDPNEANFYQTPPYNDYAKWVHEVCPNIYAFAYDDHHAKGGYMDCVGASEVRITFCPGG